MGDLNAHHSMELPRPTGRLILNAVEGVNACILNDDHSPPNSDISIINLIIASPDFAPFCEVKVYEDIMGSDHFPIEIKGTHGSTTSTKFVISYISLN